MKQKIYILGLVTTLTILLGAIFKINHFPGAGILLTLGITSTVLVFLPTALISSYRKDEDRKNPGLYIVTWITCLVVFTGMLFKIMHWPYAGLILMIALPFPYIVFLPVFIIRTSGIRNFNINITVAVLILLMVSSVLNGLLSLNVSRNRIDDSLNLSDHYNNVETAIPPAIRNNTIGSSIDKVLATIDEYQARILNREGLTEEQWIKDPHRLKEPYSRQAVLIALADSDDLAEGKKLENDLKSLIGICEQNSEYKVLALVLPSILDLGSMNEGPSYIRLNFTGYYLSWTLIWLDAMETNLKMIKTTV